MNQDVYSGRAVKRAAWHFLSGKAVSALLTLIILLWLVRLLPVAEYGAYAVLIAGTELGFAVAALGLPWLAARYLPDYRLHADGPALARLCRQLMLWQALALIVIVAVIAVVLDVYLRWADLSSYRNAAWFALAVLVFEGLGRFLREALMAPLMLQRQARVSLILRQLVFLLSIAGLVLAGQVELTWILLAEAVASALGWFLAFAAITRHLRALRDQRREAGWQAPRIGAQWNIALRMHAAHLLTLAYSPQVFLILVQRTLGAEAAALFGFLRVIHDQIARYLPAMLLFTVLRPKLMASHLQGGMAEMAGLVNLAGKLSLFLLLPLVVLVALGGDDLISLLSGDKFTSGGMLLLGLLLALVPFSQRQLIETVAVATGRAGLCTFGSLIGLLALPLMIFLLVMGLGLWAPVLAILLGQALFNATVLTGLAHVGYSADWLGGAKLATSAFIAWLTAGLATLLESQVFWLVLAGVLSAVVYLMMTWRLHAFTGEERQRLDSLLGRRLFAR